MTDKEHSVLRETIKHNMEQEYHWQAERQFWIGTVIITSLALIATPIAIFLLNKYL